MSQTSGATRRLWDAKAPSARETDGDGLRLVAYASESAPSLPFFRNSMQRGHCPFQFGLCSAKRRGHGRLGRVDTGLFARTPLIGTNEHANTHRRCLRISETRCAPPPEIQKLKAIGIIRDDLRGTLMTKNEQFLSSNEKTQGSLFA